MNIFVLAVSVIGLCFFRPSMHRRESTAVSSVENPKEPRYYGSGNQRRSYRVLAYRSNFADDESEEVSGGKQSETRDKIQKIASPDRTLWAYVITRKSRDFASSESKLEVRSSKGKILCSRNFVSTDGTHGMKILQCEWTANSEYLVFNGEGTAGHQPGHLPTYFYSRAKNKIYDLDPFVGIWITGDFKLVAPDTVRVRVRDRLGDGSYCDTLWRVENLGEALRKK